MLPIVLNYYSDGEYEEIVSKQIDMFIGTLRCCGYRNSLILVSDCKQLLKEVEEKHKVETVLTDYSIYYEKYNLGSFKQDRFWRWESFSKLFLGDILTGVDFLYFDFDIIFLQNNTFGKLFDTIEGKITTPISIHEDYWVSSGILGWSKSFKLTLDICNMLPSEKDFVYSKSDEWFFSVLKREGMLVKVDSNLRYSDWWKYNFSPTLFHFNGPVKPWDSITRGVSSTGCGDFHILNQVLHCASWYFK